MSKDKLISLTEKPKELKRFIRFDDAIKMTSIINVPLHCPPEKEGLRNPKMAFSKCHLYFLWYYLVIAILICTTEASPIRTKRFLFHQVEETIEKMKNTISTNINQIFNNRRINDNNANIKELSTTTALPNVGSRQIIIVPIRCEPHYVNVNGKCRLNIE
ncbi:hypothetical protein M0804_008654 [Polistes exclamans]|nr:hypothetical protein M0804_008654 [Polistes exclamans]